MRLSDEEYDRRIVALYKDLPPVPSREQRRQVRRRELDLAVDHRLGTDFPQERREALWAVQQRVDRRRGRLILWHLLRRLVPGALERKANRLADFLKSQYATVLTAEELERFFHD